MTKRKSTQMKSRAPKNNDDIRPPKGFGFWVIEEGKKSKVFMVRCFACDKEIPGPGVADGFCCWCGHDANKNHKSLALHTEPRR